MSLTIEDIAKESNVSKMTVSRVINNSSNVNEKTRIKIQNIIKKRGYTSNIFAKNLAGGRGLNLVGVIVTAENFFSKYYFMEIIRNVEKYIEEKDYDLFMYNLFFRNPEGFKRKLGFICDLYRSKLIKGVILFAPPIDDGRIKFLSKNNVKGIIIGGDWKDKNFGTIDVRDTESVKNMISYMIESGHRKIAMITGPDTLISAKRRQNAFDKTLKKNNIVIPHEYIVNGFYNREGGRLAAEKLFKLKTPPTAIFAANDDMAMGVYDEAHRKSMRIPEDISVGGFDDIDEAVDFSPPLTTIAQPLSEIGEWAAKAFIEEDYKIKKVLPSILIKRSSIKVIKR